MALVPTALLLLAWTVFLAPAHWHATREHDERAGVRAWFGAAIAAAVEQRAQLWQQAWPAFVASPSVPATDPDDPFGQGPYHTGIADVLHRSDALVRHGHHLLYRLSLLWSLAPCWGWIGMAAIVDGAVRRRNRRDGFGAPSPLAQKLGVTAFLSGSVTLVVLLVWPAAVSPLLFALVPMAIAVSCGWILAHTAVI